MLLKALNSNSLRELKVRLSLFVRRSPRQSIALVLLLVVIVCGSTIPVTKVVFSNVLVKDQKVYEIPGVDNFKFLDEVDPDKKLRPVEGYVSIDQAHRQGQYHTGAWIMLVDSTGRKVLLLKRGPQLVTCPNAWGLVGEHTLYNETALETVQRGLLEEVWGGDNSSYVDVQYIRNLTAYPIYYYNFPGPGERIDRQLTYLFEVRLKHEAENVVLHLDHEVADHQWVDVAKYKQWIEKDIATGHKDFCNPYVTKLALLTLKRFAAVAGLAL